MDRKKEITVMEIVRKLIQQPLEGLLYDLDLMPEQCITISSNMKRLTIEELYKQNKAYTEQSKAG